jgi:hypothetical protein
MVDSGELCSICKQLEKKVTLNIIDSQYTAAACGPVFTSHVLVFFKVQINIGEP